MSNSKLITCAEFQLFLDQNPDFAPDHWWQPRFPKGTGKNPVLGLTSGAAQAFCDWLTRREDNPEWIYRLPEVGEAEDGECCWQTLSGVFLLSRPQLIEMPLKDWLIDDLTVPPRLLTIMVGLNGYRTHRLAVDLDLARALASASALASALARALASASALARDLASALASDLALASALASDLALALDRAGNNASALDRNIALHRALDRTHELIDNLAEAAAQLKSRYQRLHQLVDLFRQVAQIIKGYIEIALLLNQADRGYRPVRLLLKQGKVEDYRRETLLAAVAHYEKQPTKLLNSGEWEKWRHDLDDLLQGYATLVMYEKRRTGEWEPFEGLRIVKARRKE